MGVRANVIDGKVVAESTPTYEETKPGDSLGKNAFLKLLVAQMQYQDPMEPVDNTQYVSELAQFSALEEMQNVSASLDNQNAFGLVGKHVIIAVGSSEGNVTSEIAGKVDYIQMVNGKAKLSINENMYDLADLEYVVGDDYINPDKKG